MMKLAVQRSRGMSRLPWELGMLGTLVLGGGGLLLVPASVYAQHTQHTHETAGGSGGEHSASHLPSAKTQEQIAAVEQAVAALNTSDTLSAGGFRPVFGMIPTMGVHWVSVDRMLNTVDLLQPGQMMISRVGGKEKLVGVAYAFLGHATDAPDLFDGDQDAWHEHPELAPPGVSAVMLHVWFVPSPDGPFAGHNPWLAYWAAGVEPPADSVMAVPATAARARQLALALAEAVEPLAVAQARGTGSPLEAVLEQVQGDALAPATKVALPPSIEARRDSLRAAIPRLNAARSAGDQAAWDREADAAIAVWKQVRDAYIAAVPAGEPRDRLAAFYEEMATGQHAH